MTTSRRSTAEISAVKRTDGPRRRGSDARWRASSPREPASAVLKSLMQLRQEIEHRRDDDVDRYELDALKPIGMSVPANNRADECADEGPLPRGRMRVPAAAAQSGNSRTPAPAQRTTQSEWNFQV